MGSRQNIGGQVTIKNLLRPANQVAAAAFALVGSTLDCESLESLLIEVKTGAATGTPTTLAVDGKLQDSADGSTWADVAADAQNPVVAITQITAVDISRFIEVNRRGLRRYLRMVFTVAFTGGSTPAVGLSASAAAQPLIGPPVHS